MAMPNGQVFTATAESILRCQEQFRPQELANIAWSWAVVRHPVPASATGAICRETMVKLGEFAPKDLANVAWRFQTLAHRDDEFFRAIREASVASMTSFNAQDVANMAWVSASQKCRDQRLLETLSHRITELSEFRPLNLAAIAWSLGTLKFFDHDVLADLSAKSLPQIQRGDFDPHSIASIAWSFATLVYHGTEIFEAIGGLDVATWRPQDLANVAWSFAVMDRRQMPVMMQVAERSAQTWRSFRQEELEMLLWSLAPSHWDKALEIFHQADRLGRLRPLGVSPILAEAERQKLQGLCMDLLLTSRACSSFRSVSRGLAGVRSGSESLMISEVEIGAAKSKPISALEYVLQHGPAGDAHEVLRLLEKFALEVLRPQRQWFKIAAGDKAQVVEHALRRAPEKGDCLEIGTYVGYTAIRCALRRPASQVVSIEVEPEHAVVSQCLAFHARVHPQVQVWIGQSCDVLSSLGDRGGQKSDCTPRFAMVFMDQCGSRFWADLKVLIDQELLLPGAIILADNVLKPGAPLFLWELFHGQGRDVFTSRHLISLDEFAMPGVEDCMLMATYTPSTEGHVAAVSSVPSEVQALGFEAAQIRTRAAEPGGVPFEEWSAHGERLKQALQKLDIQSESDLSCLPHSDR